MCLTLEIIFGTIGSNDCHILTGNKTAIKTKHFSNNLQNCNNFCVFMFHLKCDYECDYELPKKVSNTINILIDFRSNFGET